MSAAEKIGRQTETLDHDELVAITGYTLPSKQMAWLMRKGWKYATTAANRPVVGRVYARLKLAGIDPSSTNAVAEPWTLDLSRVG
jgi:hypothetical protein